MGEFYEVEIRSNLDSRSGSGLFFKGQIWIRLRKKTRSGFDQIKAGSLTLVTNTS